MLDRYQIAMRYATSYFVVDVVSALPWRFVAEVYVPAAPLTLLRALRLLKLSKLSKAVEACDKR